MGLMNATLKGGAKFFDKARPNGLFTRQSKGIMHSEFAPRIFTPAGAALAIGGTMLATVGSEALDNHGKRVVGRVNYDIPARLTSDFTSGTVEALHRASGGNYEAFADMANEIVSSPNAIQGFLDDHGANPQFIRAMYNMR